MRNIYRATFDQIHASEQLREEVRKLTLGEKRPKHWISRKGIAAALIVLLVGTACTAAICRVEILPIEPEEMWTDAPVSFQVSGEVERTPWESFSREVRDMVQERIEARKPVFGRHFSTWSEAEEYLGVDVPGLEAPTSVSFVMENGTVTEVKLDGDLDEGNLEYITLSLEASLYTEAFEGKMGDEYYFSGMDDSPEQIDLLEEEYSLQNGNIAKIVISSMENGGLIAGFLARDHVLYTVSAIYLTGKQEQAETIVKELLEAL